MTQNRKIRILALVAFAMAVVFGITTYPAFAAENTLVIVHENDLHGALKPSKDKKIDEKDLVGGSAYIAAMINQIRSEYPGKVLLLSAGDVAQGSPVSNIFAGRPVIDAMNAECFDAMTIGNHEFDWGLAALENMKKAAKFPIISANIVYQKNPSKHILDMKPYIIKNISGLKVGILGLTTTETPTITKASNVVGLKFIDPAKAARIYIPKMKKEGADFIVVLSHLGFDADINLAEKVKGINVIVGGHSHTINMNTKKVGETLVVQAGSRGKYLGKLVMSIDPKTKEIKSFTENNEIIPVKHEGLTPDPKVEKIVSFYDNKIKGKMSRILATTPEDLTRSTNKEHGDSVLGNLITDSLRITTNSDVAIYNSGGIRADLNKGNLTVEDMFNVLPFDNTVVYFNIPGSVLAKVLAHGAAMRDPIQISGATFTINYSKPSGERLENVLINGKPLEPGKIYRVSTVDFIFTGGDGFNFTGAGKAKYSDDARAVFSQYVAKMKAVKIPETNRITLIGK